MDTGVLFVWGAWSSLVAVVIVAVLSTYRFRLYIEDWLTLRSLFIGKPKLHRLAKELHWYGMSLDQVMSIQGLVSIYFHYTLRSLIGMCGMGGLGPSTEDNHNLKQFYTPKFIPQPPEVCNPTKWFDHGLQSKAWHTDTLDAQMRQKLNDNVKVIFKEFMDTWEKKKNAHPDAKTELASGFWDWRFLYGVGGKNTEVCRMVPKTTKIVESMPICKPFGFVFFSRLEPGTVIKRHTGASNLRMRVHLGLDIPAGEDIQISVGGEKRPWIQDDCIAFEDAFDHFVEHHGKSNRLVLIVDLWHPNLSNAEVEALSHPVFGRFGKSDGRRVLD